jgi:hypothetical protein
MNDLNTLLERAAGPSAALVDAHADLTRGHRALTRTRRRRGALGLVGVAAAGVVGVGIVRFTEPDGDVAADKTQTHHQKGTGTGISFLAQPFEAGPYTFDQTPVGWEVQGAYPQGVTIAPVGFPDQEPSSFVGKLVILFDGNPLSGEQVQRDGRTFWVRGDSGYTTIATPTLPGEPTGNVLVQFPDDTGWTRDTMLTFLASVHVGPGAQQGVG